MSRIEIIIVFCFLRYISFTRTVSSSVRSSCVYHGLVYIHSSHFFIFSRFGTILPLHILLSFLILIQSSKYRTEPAFLWISLHFSTFLYISLHFSVFLCISLHFSAFLCISLHFSAFLWISLHFSTFYCIFSAYLRPMDDIFRHASVFSTYPVSLSVHRPIRP